MIYCPNSDCAKPRNQESSSFCSQCGTPLKIGDRFVLTEPLGAISRAYLATDQHLPSKPRCVVINRGELSVEAGWNSAQLARLEFLGNQGHLPRLIALVDYPTTPNGSAPQTLLAHAWLGEASLAQGQERHGATDELTLRQHLNSVLSDLIQIHDQGFIHGDIRPHTLIQRSTDQRLVAASYREIAPICEINQPAQGQTQDLQVLQYWAPERKLGQAVPASDLYSLGVTAIQLLTAQPLEKLFDVAEDCWCWEDSLETELSDGLKALLNCMLERATRRRYGSAVDVLRDLAHLDDLAELADLAEPIAPLQQPEVYVPFLPQAHEDGVIAEKQASGDTTAELKESEIETFPLKKGAANQNNANDSRSLPIGNALKDADHQAEATAGLEQTVICGQFQQEESPSTDALAEPSPESLAEPEQSVSNITPLAAQPEKKIRIPQSLIAEEPAERELAEACSPEPQGESLQEPSTPEDSHGASDAEIAPENAEATTLVNLAKPADSSGEAPATSQDDLALEALDTLGLSKRSGNEPDASPSGVSQKSEDAVQDPASLSLSDSVETPTVPPQELEAESNSRRSHQNTRELVAKVLTNPLAISIGSLVQQLTQRHATQENTYLPWEIMQSLKQLKRTPETQTAFATQLLEMANFYRDQVSQGHRDLPHLTIAIVSYEQALTGLNQDHSAWPNVCHDLGHMYLNLSRQHPNYRNACIKKSVLTFKRGIVQAEVNDEAYLELQNQLGEAYGALASSEAPAENWQGAIAAYQAALKVCDAETPDPTGEQEIHRNERHGAIQNNLGTALWNLSLHCPNREASEHLQGAIAAYSAALAHHDPDVDPVRFGMIQNNLGTAYLNLAQSEKSIDLLRLATGTYQVALMYRKRNEVPLAHAATQNNLGAATLQLASHAYADPQTQRESLEQSIFAYEAALSLVRELSTTGAMSIGFDTSASRLNLALAHQRRGCLTESDQNSSVIFAHLETAMQIYLSLLEKQPPESEIHEMALEYLGKTMHHLSEHLHIADDHPLLTQVPNSVVVEMSQQFQRQLQQAS